MATRTERLIEMIDIQNPIGVEVEIRKDGRVLWVNVDGICRLRVTQSEGPLHFKYVDERDGGI